MSAHGNSTVAALPPASSNSLPSPRQNSGSNSPNTKTSPNGHQTVLLPDIKSHENRVDKAQSLPSPILKDYVPEDILFALTQSPQGRDLLGPTERLRNINTSTVVARKAPAAVWNFPKRREKLEHLTKHTPCICGAGKDISFLYDVPKKKEEPNVPLDPRDKSSVRKEEGEEPPKSGLKLPDTLIPEEYHIVKNKGVLGLEYHDDKFSTKPEDHEKHLVVFPSMVPTSRYEVLKLKETLTDMLRKAGILDGDLDVKGPTQIHNLLELIKKEQNIYNIVFHELIRQVSVECIERGELLAELRNCYSNLLNKIPGQIKSVYEEVLAQRALDRRLTEELMRFKSTIGVLTGELYEVKRHDKDVTNEASVAQDEDQDLDAFQPLLTRGDRVLTGLKAALTEAKKNSGLLTEYHDLYELQRKRLEKQVALLDEEKEIWSTTAYSLALKVIEEHSLNTAKRLHISEKGWIKLAKHFTILLSDNDTETLTRLQDLIEGFRDSLDVFDRKLKNYEEETLESLAKVQISIDGWISYFKKHVLSGEGHLAKIPDKETTVKLYNDIKQWDEMLHMESEKFGGETLLEGEEMLYDITKKAERWSECALKVFSRHKREDGSNYPDHEIMKELSMDLEELFKQYQVRLTGENGVATGFITIMNNLDTWSNKFNSVTMGNNPLPDTEWIRFYQLLDDWIVNIEDAAKEVGGTQKRDDKAEGLPHKRVDPSEVLSNLQKWLSSTTNGIDSEDAKLVEQVTGLHTEMVKWMVQMLLRIAPDKEGQSQEAKQAVLLVSASVQQLESSARNLFHQLESFTKHVFQCCHGIVMADRQDKVEKNREKADHEYQDLLRLQTECEEWVSVAKLLLTELTGDVWEDKLTGNISDQPSSISTLVIPSVSDELQADQQVHEKDEENGNEDKPQANEEGQEQLENDLKETQSAPENVRGDETIPAPQGEAETPISADDSKDTLPTHIEYIGSDTNTYRQPLEHPEERPHCSEFGVPLPYETPVKPGTPDTKRAYQALAAIENLQMQLVATEERAQLAEDNALGAENALKTAHERIATLEKRLEDLGIYVADDSEANENKNDNASAEPRRPSADSVVKSADDGKKKGKTKPKKK